MALLAAITLHFRDSHAVNAEREERIADLLELERLDDRSDQFHEATFITLF
jgi:hypothetical protein